MAREVFPMNHGTGRQGPQWLWHCSYGSFSEPLQVLKQHILCTWLNLDMDSARIINQ